MKEVKDILPLIKPNSNDENGKYSRKLYNLLKKHSLDQYKNRQLRVFFYKQSRWIDNSVEFHRDVHKEVSMGGHIFISPYGDSSSGHHLFEVLQKNNPEHWSLVMYDPNLFTDVTEWFFTTYIQIGRCMFDKSHYDFDNKYNNRYYTINKNHRKCKWCGEHFHREFRRHVEVHKYVDWVK